MSPDVDVNGNRLHDATVNALLPDGAITPLATLPGLWDGFADRRDLYPPVPLLCPLLVSDTFFIAVAFTSIDHEGLSRLVLYDLRHPGAGPLAQLETPTDPCEYRWGPGGKLALDRYNESLRAVIDTTTLLPHSVRIDPQVQVIRRLWTLDGTAWQAWRTVGNVTDSGTVSATTGEFAAAAQVPSAWPYSGGEPMSADGMTFWSWDSGPRPACTQLVTGSLGFMDQSTRTVWWDSCQDTGQIWSQQWDVDGRGLLVLVEDRGQWTFERWPRPGKRELLARFKLPPVRELHVEAIAPGPTPDRLQVVFHALGDDGGGLYVVRSGDTEAITLFSPRQNPGGFAGVVPFDEH